MKSFVYGTMIGKETSFFSCYISYFIEWSFYKSSYCMHVFVSIVVPLVMSPWGYHHDPDNPLLVLYFKNKSSRSSQENKMLPEKNIFVVLMMQPKIDHKNLRFYSPCSIYIYMLYLFDH